MYAVPPPNNTPIRYGCPALPHPARAGTALDCGLPLLQRGVRLARGINYNPVWTPDGKRVAYSMLSEGIYWAPADGSGKVTSMIADLQLQVRTALPALDAIMQA